MKKQKSQQKQAAKKEKSPIFFMLPLILILGVVPLMVRLHISTVPMEAQAFWKTSYDADFFSYYKAGLIIVLALYILVLLLYYNEEIIKKSLLTNKALRVYYVAIGVFALFAILSTMFAQYKNIALFGAPERYEGLFVILAYAIIFLFTLWVYLKNSDFRYILLPLCVTTGVMGFLGVFQFFGHDLMKTAIGEFLTVPGQYRGTGEMVLQFEHGKIYGTMYHYNYMGSFGAMMVPFFLVLALFLPERKHQLFCAGFTLIALFLLLGSTSRAGIVGVVLAALCFVVVFAKKLKQHSKLTVGVVAGLAVLVILINTVTGGLALARIPSLLADMKAIVATNDTDYHDKIVIRQIDLEAQEATFVFQDKSSLNIVKNAQGQPVLTKSDGEVLVASINNDTIAINQQIEMDTQYITINEVSVPFLKIYINDRLQMVLGLFDDEFSFVNDRGQRVEYVEAPSIGLEGKERLGSARGYIWSRSMPMFIDHLLIGSGPDTYFAEFPQGDYLAKLYAYNNSLMLVDKPHNLYLQIGIQQGGLALVAFLVMMGAYLLHSFKLYALREEYNVQQTIGAAICLAIIGYLGAGIFNDSLVSVAPIFWVLLGTGIATNYLNENSVKDK